MPHIHTQPGHYDFTTSAIIVRTDLGDPAVCMNKHLLSGKWTQPGGHVELNESPWSAVQHEITEESGYTLHQLQILQPKNRITNLGSDAQLQPLPVCIMTYELAAHKNHLHTDLVYAFVANGAPAQAVAADESTEIAFFNKAKIKSLSSKEIPDNVRSVALFVLDTCMVEWERIAAENLYP